MKKRLVVAIASIAISGLAATLAAQTSHQQTAVDTASAPPPNSVGEKDKPTLQPGSERYPRYKLTAGDVLDLTFDFTPEFNQSVTIQPDGYVSLREVGDVRVAGRTVPEVSEEIRTAYGKILENPSISIVLKDFEKPYVVVGGQVARPGKYDLRGDMTVTQALAIAGGLNNSAKHSQVVLFRRVSEDWYEAKLINVKKILKSRDLNEDTHLKSGDTLYVPQSALSKIRQFVPNPGLGLGATF